MSEPKVVYVVTSGCYSSYTIENIFDDEVLAKRYVEMENQVWRDADRGVEVWELNGSRSWVERGIIAFRIIFDQNGDVWNIGGSSDGERDEGESIGPFERQLYINRFDGKNPEVLCTTAQPDRETAIKVCAERRAQFLAEREGMA